MECQNQIRFRTQRTGGLPTAPRGVGVYCHRIKYLAFARLACMPVVPIRRVWVENHQYINVTDLSVNLKDVADTYFQQGNLEAMGAVNWIRELLDFAQIVDGCQEEE